MMNKTKGWYEQMKTSRWISLVATAGLALAAAQARAADTTKGERFGVGPIYAVNQAGGGQKLACPHCKSELTAVRMPADTKGRAHHVRYVQEHRCPGCKFVVKVTKAGSKETRTTMVCSPACKP